MAKKEKMVDNCGGLKANIMTKEEFDRIAKRSTKPAESAAKKTAGNKK